MFKKRIEKVLIFLKETFIIETAEAREMLKVYYDYTQGKASDEAIDSANQQLNKLVNFSIGKLAHSHLAKAQIGKLITWQINNLTNLQLITLSN